MAGKAGVTKHKARKESPPSGDLEEILRKIRDARNFDFRDYKRPTLLRRIQRRMQDRKKRTVREYGALLDREPAEFDALLSSMFIKVTSFFRDPETWEELSGKAIPQMLSAKRPGEEIRVWCAGCATGEENFTAAILLAEAMGHAFHTTYVKVFGTDVDEKAIALARHAVYPPAALEPVPRKLRGKYFEQER